MLLALVVLGALGGALAHRAIAQGEAASGLARADAARAAADASVVAAWRGWDGVLRAADSVGLVERRTIAADSAVVELTTWHPSPRLWWISAQAWGATGPLGRPSSRAAALGLWLAVDVPMPVAAVTGAAAVTIQPAAHLDGPGGAGAGWTCPLRPLEAADLSASGSLAASTGSVTGPVRIGAGNVCTAWDTAWAALVARADVSLPVDTMLTPMPGTDSTRCAAGWGDPSRSSVAPCGRRFVVVHAAGSLTLSGGQAQGLFLVEGPLVLEAGVRVAGLVVARGPVTLRQGAELVGALIVVGPGAPVRIEDTSRLLGSGCAAGAALRGGTLLTELPVQGWYQLW
ncbi:MAG: hypothetical protein HY275_00660 [Gemmatimonadetes bacterium]|nr:hypothetical protein [Gemmatimonadota bacterium]